MTNRQGQLLKILMFAILMTSMFFLAKEGAVYVNSPQLAEAKPLCVVIDAGHADSK